MVHLEDIFRGSALNKERETEGSMCGAKVNRLVCRMYYPQLYNSFFDEPWLTVENVFFLQCNHV